MEKPIGMAILTVKIEIDVQSRNRLKLAFSYSKTVTGCNIAKVGRFHEAADIG